MVLNTAALERKLRRLERLQHMAKSFEKVAKSLEDSICLYEQSQNNNDPVALREPHDGVVVSPFLERLQNRRELMLDESRTDVKNLLNLVKSSKASRRSSLASRLDVSAKQARKGLAKRALLHLRGILAEQKKRISHKRRRLQEIKQTNADAERSLVVPERSSRSHGAARNADDVSVITDPSYVEPEGLTIDCWNDNVSLGLCEETIDFDASSSSSPGDQKAHPSKEEEEILTAKEDSVTAATVDVSDLSSMDEEASRRSKLENMKERVKLLEHEKDERANTLLNFLTTVGNQTVELQMEKERIKDIQQTEYEEMKTLLVEQNYESEYLQDRLTFLEGCSMSFKKKAVGALFFWALLGALICTFAALRETRFAVEYLPGINADQVWSAVCSPVRPGTQVTEESGVFEAPWWAPAGAPKHIFYHLVGCGGGRNNHPRMQLEVKRGNLLVSSTDGHYAILKKPSKKVYVESDSIQIVDHYHKHMEVEAPWAAAPTPPPAIGPMPN